jgi:hypothetical protein
MVLISRYVSIWRGDRLALLAILAQSLAVALLLCLVFGDLGDLSRPLESRPLTVRLFFLMAVSSFWFGCNTAAKELVKERTIFLRERDFNLRVGSYFASKFLVLFLIGLVQVTLLLGMVRIWCRPDGPVVAQWATLAELTMAGTALGLLISALAQSEEVATALVPIAIIPQIILGNVVARLSGIAETMAAGFVTVYWGQDALERLLRNTASAVPGNQEEGGLDPWSIMLVQAAAAAVATVAVLWQTRAKR